MTSAPNRKTLVNGNQIYVMSVDNAEMIQTQVEEYFRHGIEDTIGGTEPVVVDAGANIGLFTLEVLARTNGRARVYCYEPIPEAFEILALNLQHCSRAKVTAIPKGLGATTEAKEFSFNPAVPLISTMYDINLDIIVERILTIVYNKSLDPSYRQAVPAVLGLLPRPLLRLLLRAFMWLTKKRTRRVRCDVETVSELIARENLAAIDLLKIDVEKAELDVLHGIAEEDWPKIGAIAMEVHDLNGRLETIQEILRRHSFVQITVTQEEFYRDSDVYSLYALRSAAAPGLTDQPSRPA